MKLTVSKQDFYAGITFFVAGLWLFNYAERTFLTRTNTYIANLTTDLLTGGMPFDQVRAIQVSLFSIKANIFSFVNLLAESILLIIIAILLVTLKRSKND